MIRVVLDTNILISALLQPLGLPAQVFLLAIADPIQLWKPLRRNPRRLLGSKP
jgi:predicted nucleic acid-binding protein